MIDKTLIVVEGPTGSGKTSLAIEIAETLHCEIVSADSRQLFRGLPIGTAAPTPEEMARVKHHLVSFLDLDEYYSAARFEEDVMALLRKLWQKSDYAVMCGGSMMYIDAVCHGIDRLPTVSQEVRDRAYTYYAENGLEALREKVREVDPEYYQRADKNNYKRLVHALEVSWEAGVPYSTLCTGEKRQRPFSIVKMAIDWSREELFDRINRRVEEMIDRGLEEEARRVYHLRHLNALNTVGYKEMFAMFDGTMDRATAIARMAKNTRVYAKKQLTWMRRDEGLHLLDPHRPLLAQALAIINP